MCVSFLEVGSVLEHLAILLALTLGAGIVEVGRRNRSQRKGAATLLVIYPDGTPVAGASVANSHGADIRTTDVLGRVTLPPPAWARSGSRLQIGVDGKVHIRSVELERDGNLRPIEVPFPRVGELR